MSFRTITTDTDDRGILTLSLNRSEKRNAMSAEMIEELTTFAARMREAPSARAVVLRGAGRVFCAGGDLEWMRAQISADRAMRMAEARKLAMMLKALNEIPVPLIGRVHGAAMGGGVGLACVCDVVIATEGTRFGLTETRLGLIPATIGPYVVARMGEGAARRVFMSARIFSAQEAMALGLVADVVAEEQLDARIASETEPYLHTAPGAVAAAKALARALGPRIDTETIEASVTALADTWERPEALEGISAFLEKRSPPWDT